MTSALLWLNYHRSLAQAVNNAQTTGRAKWTFTNNFTLMFPALSPSWSNHPNPDIHGDVYFRYFSVLIITVQCPHFRNQRTEHDPPLCEPALTCLYCDWLQQHFMPLETEPALSFQHTWPAAASQPSNTVLCDLDFTCKGTPQKSSVFFLGMSPMSVRAFN